MIAAFNLDKDNQAVTGNISPEDVDGLCGEEFAVYEHFSKQMKILHRGESFELQLKDSDEFKLYILVPLKDGCGMIGRVDKFISPKTVRYNRKGEAELVEAGPYAYVKDRALIFAG